MDENKDLTGLSKKEKQREWERQWRQKHPERIRYHRYKSNAKIFIKKFATPEDLETIEALLAERKSELD